MQCEEKSTTMQPTVGGKLSKSEESYPNARETPAPESVQFKEKYGKIKKVRKSKESYSISAICTRFRQLVWWGNLKKLKEK